MWTKHCRSSSNPAHLVLAVLSSEHIPGTLLRISLGEENFVDHTITDQTSVIHFIEDNWLSGQRIGNGSLDALSGPINNMFDFGHMRHDGRLFLDPNTGERE